MLRGFGNIKYYAMCLLAVTGIYSWAELTGRRIMGDDNVYQEAAAGTARRAGGHGFYYHK